MSPSLTLPLKVSWVFAALNVPFEGLEPVVPGIARHYIRIGSAIPGETTDEDPNRGVLVLANQRPGARYEYPAKEIVDAGFLELVRYGIRLPDDPVIVNSLRVIDAVLKVETPFGPCWRNCFRQWRGRCRSLW